MTLEVIIPETNIEERTVKDLVFSILIEDEDKTLTQLHREIKRKYKLSVSFQAVIKAVNSLLKHKVLIKNEKNYNLNKEWIFETRNFFDKLYTDHFKVKKPLRKVELGKEVTVYTIHNLLELDRLWNDLLTNWAKKEIDDKRNCWKGKHAWWLIPRLQEEDILHDLMLKNNIKVFNLWSENTPLDKQAVKYYSGKNENAKIQRKNSKNDEHISAFGDYFLKFTIPESISKKLEKIYKNTKNVKDLNVKEIMDIFKENSEIELMIIKDQFFADKIKEEIISYFKC